jgi:hypothetical protein
VMGTLMEARTDRMKKKERYMIYDIVSFFIYNFSLLCLSCNIIVVCLKPKKEAN